MDFDTFFKQATTHDPYPYQRAIAEGGFPEVIEVPTGAGKTEAVVLGWLYNRLFHPNLEARKATPRRLILAQPMRTLVEQTHDRIALLLARLGLAEEVTLHVLMGGHLDAQKLNQWRADLHKPTIVIGTVDCVVSRALNRGYGTSRSSYPIDFALVTNGALVVLDEIQLAPQAAATQRQLAAFQRGWGTAEPAGLVCMSATVDTTALNVVDNPWRDEPGRVLRISEADRAGALRARLDAAKTVTKVPVATPAALASEAASRHRGGLTLVVVNTVDMAVATFKALKRLKPDADLMLLHSRFRGVDRAAWAQRLHESVTSRIIVSTQVIEAGVDLDASVLMTEVAPWSSLVQRAGRCNRTGKQPEAVLAWFDAIGRGPYEQADLDATASALALLEGEEVSPASLGTLTVPQSVPELRFIRRRDVEALFDTTPDLAGRDVDISRYIRPNEQLDLQIAWINADGAGPAPQTALPPEPLRCSVPMGVGRKFLDRDDKPRAWVFNSFDDRWRPYAKGPLAPQQVILVDAAGGGYTTEFGFDHLSKVPVPVPDAEPPAHEDETAASEASSQTGSWEALSTHLAATGEQARQLVDTLGADLPDRVLAAIAAAAALHDIGKQHVDWQRALCESVGEVPGDELLPVAKSPGRGRLRITRQTANGSEPRRAFRHELVSALLLGTDEGHVLMRDQGLTEAEFDLCRYLVAAHHGRIRLQPRDPLAEGRDGASLHGLVDGEPLMGGWAPTSDAADAAPTVDLAPFRSGENSWSGAALGLLAELGPFRLAYAETLVRMADWRASGQLPLPEEPS